MLASLDIQDVLVFRLSRNNDEGTDSVISLSADTPRMLRRLASTSMPESGKNRSITASARRSVS